MSYSQGRGRLYLGNVKWSTDNKNVFLFGKITNTNERAKGKLLRDDWMKTHLNLIKNNIIWQSPNTFVDINGRIKGLDTVNYCYYIPDESIGDNPFCCFVTDYDYLSANTTRLYLKCDTWQTFIYNTTLYQSYIQRGIIKKSADIVGANLQAEPFSPSLEYQDEITTIQPVDDWSPVWVLHSASRFNDSTKKYEYSGFNNNSFGEYGIYITSKQELENIIAKYGRKSMDDIVNGVDWKSILNSFLSGGTNPASVSALTSATSIAELQDHRDELIGVYAIPKWAYNLRDNDTYATNSRLNTAGTTIQLKTSTLSNNYTPRNKKMLTSICRGYMLANRTGLKIGLKPELFSGNSTKIILSNVNMGTNGYQYYIENYSDKQASFGDVLYGAERRVGFDSNTGLNKIINSIGAIQTIAQPISQISKGIAEDNIASIIGGFGNLSTAGISAIDQIGQHGQAFGTNSDVLKITGGRATLRFFELAPSINECEAIDDFFDMYGYSINEHKTIGNYTNNRSNWDFVKTDNANIRTYAPAKYEQEIKSIFDSGVRIWHNYEHYNDFTQPNNDSK